jgi:chemotaxis protein methyltransferase CheR
MSTFLEIYEFINISDRILKKAALGKYSQLEVQRGMPTNLLLKYFSKDLDENWVLKNEIKKKVEFKQLNLRSDSYLNLKFDLILCRNVLIYQKIEAKSDILKRLSYCLKPTGLLLMGSGESMLGFENKFEININDGVAYYSIGKKINSFAS